MCERKLMQHRTSSCSGVRGFAKTLPGLFAIAELGSLAPTCQALTAAVAQRRRSTSSWNASRRLTFVALRLEMPAGLDHSLAAGNRSLNCIGSSQTQTPVRALDVDLRRKRIFADRWTFVRAEEDRRRADRKITARRKSCLWRCICTRDLPPPVLYDRFLHPLTDARNPQ